MVGHIIDTYAWVEYFRGSIEPSFRWIIETGGNKTPTIVLAELKNKYVKEDVPNFESDLDFIRAKSDINPLDEATAIQAGEIRAKMEVPGMGLVDCILLALSRRTGFKVLTGDTHFEDMPEARMIK